MKRSIRFMLMLNAVMLLGGCAGNFQTTWITQFPDQTRVFSSASIDVTAAGEIGTSNVPTSQEISILRKLLIEEISKYLDITKSSGEIQVSIDVTEIKRISFIKRLIYFTPPRAKVSAIISFSDNSTGTLLGRFSVSGNSRASINLFDYGIGLTKNAFENFVSGVGELASDDLYAIKIQKDRELAAVRAEGGESVENRQENWYMYWGLGTSRVTWPGEFNDVIELLDARPFVSRTQKSIDMLGLYKPINPNTMVGFIVNGAFDALEVEGESMQVTFATYAASAQYFPEEIGKGMFGRVDIGPAVGLVHQKIGVAQFRDETLYAGLGFLVGVGYAHPITDGTRLALNVNYAIRRMEGESWKTLGISLGGLF